MLDNFRWSIEMGSFFQSLWQFAKPIVASIFLAILTGIVTVLESKRD